MSKEVKQSYINELVKLQSENPNARVMCFVSDDCTYGDYAYQSAEFGRPRLETMTLWDDVWSDDEDYIKEQISDNLYVEVGNTLSDAGFDFEVEKMFKLVKWETLIVIYIEPS